jgi:hypothetical protein
MPAEAPHLQSIIKHLQLCCSSVLTETGSNPILIVETLRVRIATGAGTTNALTAATSRHSSTVSFIMVRVEKRYQEVAQRAS